MSSGPGFVIADVKLPRKRVNVIGLFGGPGWYQSKPSNHLGE
jgi:hypothetical protein